MLPQFRRRSLPNNCANRKNAAIRNSCERPVPQTADRAEDSCVRNYRAKACELIDADLNASLKYVRLLANARSPAELIELSANHARAHFELVIKHAAALVALSRSMMGAKD